jgi:N utilization substance protein A
MLNSKLSSDTIKLISLFSKVTGVFPKDCFVDDLDNLVFVIPPRTVKKAFGPNAKNLKRLTDLLKRKFKIIEYSDDLTRFVRNVILPLKVDTIERTGDIVYIRSNDVKTKGLLIGRNAKNLRALERVVQKYFPDIKEIKVE